MIWILDSLEHDGINCQQTVEKLDQSNQVLIVSVSSIVLSSTVFVSRRIFIAEVDVAESFAAERGVDARNGFGTDLKEVLIPLLEQLECDNSHIVLVKDNWSGILGDVSNATLLSWDAVDYQRSQP